jgi:3-dehydroquinate synthase
MVMGSEGMAKGAAPATDLRRSVRVALGERSYDVIIGPDLLRDLGDYAVERFGQTRFAVVTDEHVAKAHLGPLAEDLRRRGLLRTTIALPSGEKTKSFDQLRFLCETLLADGVERRDVVIALGGGVIGDLAGFAAAILRRGVKFLQVPTSLLAQVDSSVGGKTGINTPQGKNLIGAFHQPGLVLADTATLNSLPDREMRAGYAEVVKYGLLGDNAFYGWLEDNAGRVLARDKQAVVKAVTRSVQIKADIVARDETETGERQLLNLGHTFGHALEAFTGYSDRLLHGEGVAIGMCLAFRLSEEIGAAAPQTAARVSAHIKAMGLPTTIQDISGDDRPSADGLVQLMGQDKKVRDGQLTFILARGIGDAFITREIEREQVCDFLARQLDG